MNDFLMREQRLSLELKSLYLSYGFEEYKLSGFEEYSLYSGNENFLSGKDVITFNAGGKLMALRPDVTLSVIKNVNVEQTRKLFYNEKVYRSDYSGGFSEVSQIGVEVIGEVDLAVQAELIRLMLKTLGFVGGEYVLDLSHTGVISSVLDGLGLSRAERCFAEDCLKSKNSHDFIRFAQSRNLPQGGAEAFTRLIGLPSDPDGALKELKTFVSGAALKYVEEIANILAITGTENININFSAVGDPEYYNGLVFKGYVSGAAGAVLSGGRYDNLVKKFGKNARAAGFALYLGELSGTFRENRPSPDIAVVYKDGEEEKAFSLAEKLRKSGKSVLITRTADKNFKGEIIFAGDKND